MLMSFDFGAGAWRGAGAGAAAERLAEPRPAPREPPLEDARSFVNVGSGAWTLESLKPVAMIVTRT